MSDEIDFLHADNHDSLLQIDTMTLIGIVKHSQSSYIARLQCLYNILKKKLGRVFIFSLQMNTKVSYKLIWTLWATKMPTRWYYHYCWVWWSILKVLKVISLQYLYNISKKEEEVSTSSNYFFYGSGQYVPSTQNRKLVMFLQRVLQLLLCSIVMQNIQIFYGSPAMFIVYCYLE